MTNMTKKLLIISLLSISAILNAAEYKVASPDGKYCYAPKDKETSPRTVKYRAIFMETVVSVDYGQNIVAVKCHTGMGNAACAAIPCPLGPHLAAHCPLPHPTIIYPASLPDQTRGSLRAALFHCLAPCMMHSESSRPVVLMGQWTSLLPPRRSQASPAWGRTKHLRRRLLCS